MSLVAVMTVLDRGGAESIVAALDQRDIPATIHPVPRNAYLGGATLEAFEVRVPVEHEPAARAALALTEEEQPPEGAMGWDTAESRQALPPSLRRPERPEGPRHPRLAWAVPIALCVPVPVGCLYARAGRLGNLLLWTGVTAIALLLLTQNRLAGAVLLGAKAIDLCIAPVLAAIANRARGGPDRVGVGAGVSIAIALLIVGGLVLGPYAVEKRPPLEVEELAPLGGNGLIELR